MFADDTKIYEMIHTEADASAMENDLANFQSSSANANLLLNTDKCKTLHTTRKLNQETLVSGPFLPSLSPNKSSTNGPKATSHLVIFDAVHDQ